MAESLEKLVENLLAEISNLRAQVSSGRPTAPKDLSVISLIPKWSGTEKSVSVMEFFESVESSAIIGNWSQFDKIQITVLKLTEVQRHFVAVTHNYTVQAFQGKTLWPNFCTDLEMSEVTSITLCSFRQPSNRKMKPLENFWTGVAHLL